MEEYAYGSQCSEFYLGTGLSGLEQEWLADSLKRRRGIQDVSYDAKDSTRVVVNHDADITAPLAVRDMLLLHGIDVRFSSTFGRRASAKAAPSQLALESPDDTLDEQTSGLDVA